MELMTVEKFKSYISGCKITRKISKVQLHHTYSPSYKNFDGSNHLKLQEGMKNYHVKTNCWSDIAQHFTIFPDGKIMTGRSLNVSPAGIYGANTGAICIECIGNFDKGGDTMTDAQKNAIVAVVKMLADNFKLDVSKDVVYHAWYTSTGTALGDYIKGKSSKTCPGTNFFGGNTLSAYRSNLQPLIEKYDKDKKKMLESGNDIVWELMNGKLKVEINEVKLAVNALDAAKNDPRFMSLYWILYKIVNNR